MNYTYKNINPKDDPSKWSKAPGSRTSGNVDINWTLKLWNLQESPIKDIIRSLKKIPWLLTKIL